MYLCSSNESSTCLLKLRGVLKCVGCEEIWSLHRAGSRGHAQVIRGGRQVMPQLPRSDALALVGPWRLQDDIR